MKKTYLQSRDRMRKMSNWEVENRGSSNTWVRFVGYGLKVIGFGLILLIRRADGVKG